MMLIGLSGGDRALREAIAQMLRERRGFIVSPSTHTVGVSFYINLLRMGREWDDLRVLVPFVESERLADYVRSQGGTVLRIVDRYYVPEIGRHSLDVVVRNVSSFDELYRRIDDVTGVIELSRWQAI